MEENQLKAELDAVYQSTSWRVTAPLRALSRLVQRLRSPVEPSVIASLPDAASEQLLAQRRAIAHENVLLHGLSPAGQDCFRALKRSLSGEN